MHMTPAYYCKDDRDIVYVTKLARRQLQQHLFKAGIVWWAAAAAACCLPVK
jgi:hypothetical protein